LTSRCCTPSWRSRSRRRRSDSATSTTWARDRSSSRTRAQRRLELLVLHGERRDAGDALDHVLLVRLGRVVEDRPHRPPVALDQRDAPALAGPRQANRQAPLVAVAASLGEPVGHLDRVLAERADERRPQAADAAALGQPGDQRLHRPDLQEARPQQPDQVGAGDGEQREHRQQVRRRDGLGRRAIGGVDAELHCGDRGDGGARHQDRGQGSPAAGSGAPPAPHQADGDRHHDDGAYQLPDEQEQPGDVGQEERREGAHHDDEVGGDNETPVGGPGQASGRERQQHVGQRRQVDAVQVDADGVEQRVPGEPGPAREPGEPHDRHQRADAVPGPAPPGEQPDAPELQADEEPDRDHRPGRWHGASMGEARRAANPARLPKKEGQPYRRLRPASVTCPGPVPSVSGMSTTSRWLRRLVAVARIALGLLFVFAGLPKFTSHDVWLRLFQHWHVPFPALAVFAVGGFEVVAGLLLVLGLGSTACAALLVADMAAALLFAGTRDGGAFVVEPLVLGTACALLAVFGAGAWQLRALPPLRQVAARQRFV
jgi:putative oxidoreductase